MFQTFQVNNNKTLSHLIIHCVACLANAIQTKMNLRHKGSNYLQLTTGMKE